MLPALDLAISGMKAHQDRMDAIGNNIANVDTTGFKAGRPTFAEAMSLTLAGATRPSESAGTNPIQIGGGANLVGIDTVFTQGDFQVTGQVTDLAIEGTSFFQVGDEQSTCYTRNGAFQLDALGQLVMPGSGLALQGWNALAGGELPGSAPIEAIRIPVGMASPARATTRIDLARNLDADGAAKGTTVVSQPFLKYAGEGDEPLAALKNSKGESLGLVPGSTLTFSASSGGVDFESSWKIAAGDTYIDLRTRFTEFLQRIDPAADTGRPLVPDADTRGALTVLPGSRVIENLQITSDHAPFASRIASAFHYPSKLVQSPPPGVSAFHSEPLRIGTRPDHLLRDTYDGRGTPFARSLEPGDAITVSALVGGGQVGGGRSLVYDPDTTTMQHLLDFIRDELGLSPTLVDGGEKPSAEVDPQGSEDGIADGAIVLRSLPGTAFALQDVVLTSTHSNDLSPNPLAFDGNSIFHEIQAARDAAVVDTTITAYDDQGLEHELTISFTHSDANDHWLWEVKTGADEEILSGGRGRISFGSDGTVAGFTFADESPALTIDPGPGAGIMRIELDPGPGRFDGLMQYRSASTAAVIAQDGHPSGHLRSLEIGEDGVVSGLFSNGVRQSLAQIVVAEFSTPQGLSHRAGSVLERTPNSGDPIQGLPGQGSCTIRSGALEMSNVDLAEQFTSLITTQRGYQANARALSQTDRFLEELVNLAR